MSQHIVPAVSTLPPFKTLLLGSEFQRWFLDVSPPYFQAAGFLNKATFPFHPTLVSQVLTFKQWAAGVFSNNLSKLGKYSLLYVSITFLKSYPKNINMDVWKFGQKNKIYSLASYLVKNETISFFSRWWSRWMLHSLPPMTACKLKLSYRTVNLDNPLETSWTEVL